MAAITTFLSQLRNAVITPIMFQVTCPECGEQLSAPDTNLGRTGWVVTELVPESIHICPKGHYVTISGISPTETTL